MPVHTTVAVSKGVWTCLNVGQAAAGDISVFPMTVPILLVPGTDGTTPPVNTKSGAIRLDVDRSIYGTTIAKVWPGSGGKQFLWALALGNCDVAVSCA